MANSKAAEAAKSGWAWTQLIVIPIVAAMGLATAVIGLAGPPTIATIADSGERWYNPLSWSLDEAAAISTDAANQAAIAAHTQLVWAMAAATAAAVLAAVVVLGRAVQPEAKADGLTVTRRGRERIADVKEARNLQRLATDAENLVAEASAILGPIAKFSDSAIAERERDQAATTAATKAAVVAAAERGIKPGINVGPEAAAAGAAVENARAVRAVKSQSQPAATEFNDVNPETGVINGFAPVEEEAGSAR
jgi:hypothetical protein